MAPCIPNYDDHSTLLVKPGMTFAIEPFATNGKGLIYEEGGLRLFLPWFHHVRFKLQLLARS